MESGRTIEFQSVGPLEKFPVGSSRLVQVGTLPILVLRRENRILAFEDYCPHRAGPLSEGMLTDETVECPWHGSRFDLSSGKPLCGPAKQGLKLRATRIQGDQLEIQRSAPGL